MKKLNLMQRYITTINICTFLLCSSLYGMDIKPEPMFTFIEQNTNQGIKISLSTLEMSNILKNMIDDIANNQPITVELAATVPALPLWSSSANTIREFLSVLALYKKDQNDPLLEQMINSPKLSLKELIDGINLLHYLDLNEEYKTADNKELDCKEITDRFMNGLKQRVSALSDTQIDENKEVINSLDPNLANILSQTLCSELLSEKRIELLKKDCTHSYQEFKIPSKPFAPQTGTLSHNGEKIILWDNFGAIKMFNTQTDALIWSNSDDTTAKIKSIKFSHDDRFIIICNLHAIDILDAQTYKKLQSLSFPSSTITSAASSPDNKLIVVALNSDTTKTITVLKKEKDKISYKELYSIDNEYDSVQGFNSLGTHVILGNSSFKEYYICKVNNKPLLQISGSTFKPEKYDVRTTLQFSPDNTKIVGLSPESLTVWNAKTLKIESDTKIRTPHYFTMDNTGNPQLSSIVNIALSPDNSMLLRRKTEPIKNFNVFPGPGKIIIDTLLETKTMSPLCEFDGYADPYDKTVYFDDFDFFSPDSNALVTCHQVKGKLLNFTIINLLSKEYQEKLRKLLLFDLLKFRARENFRTIEDEGLLAQFTRLVRYLYKTVTYGKE